MFKICREFSGLRPAPVVKKIPAIQKRHVPQTNIDIKHCTSTKYQSANSGE